MHKITKVKIYTVVFSAMALMNYLVSPSFNNFLRTKEHEVKMNTFEKYAHDLRVWKDEVQMIKSEFCEE